jgi:hypothetical protein
MKKIIYCFLAMLFTVFCFSACGDSNKSESSDSGKQPAVAFVENEINLAIGESVKADVVTSKKNVFVFFSVRDNDVATISSDGTITGVGEGQTICWAEFGGEKAICIIKVAGKVTMPMLSVVVPYEANSITMYANETLNLKASVKLGDTVVEDAQVTYNVSAGDVISVENGVITAKSAGSATVIVTATYEDQTTSIMVYVTVI